MPTTFLNHQQKESKMTNTIQPAQYALIGGSGTWGARFPEDLTLPDVELVDVYQTGFATPYGQSAPFKLLRIGGELVWRVAMHGLFDWAGKLWADPWIAAKQVAWVLETAGVKWALVEGSVGGIQNPDRPGEPLPPWSVTITDDFQMYWRPEDAQPFVAANKRSSRLGEPFCAGLRQALLAVARQEPKFAGVYDHGVYVCSHWGRFETPAEIKAFAALGGHTVGHTLAHEAVLMRKIGVHFASLNIVSNHAEGAAWQGYPQSFMGAFYQECPHAVGPVMVNALKQVIAHGAGACRCEEYYMSGLGRLPVAGA